MLHLGRYQILQPSCKMHALPPDSLFLVHISYLIIIEYKNGPSVALKNSTNQTKEKVRFITIVLNIELFFFFFMIY